MSHFQRIPEEINDPKDRPLWELAERRASFKKHLLVYVLVNVFLWLLWYQGGQHSGSYGLPWALWATLGWGIGIVSHYVGAYVRPFSNDVEREYEKLKRDREQQKS